MSFMRSPFSTKKAQPRKSLSRSPLKLQADELSRELGSRYQTIDVKIAEKKIDYDIQNGDWNVAGAENIGRGGSQSGAQKIHKQIDVLKEENNMLKLKVEVLLNLVAESIAEMNNGR